MFHFFIKRIYSCITCIIKMNKNDFYLKGRQFFLIFIHKAPGRTRNHWAISKLCPGWYVRGPAEQRALWLSWRWWPSTQTILCIHLHVRPAHIQCYAFKSWFTNSTVIIQTLMLLGGVWHENVLILFNPLFFPFLCVSLSVFPCPSISLPLSLSLSRWGCIA